MLSGATLAHDGYAETIEALLKHPGYTAPLDKNQGRGVASGYWFNGGGESSATMHVNEDGTVVVATGSPDIGGSRASMAIMAAETLGIEYDRVRPIVADTTSVGYTHVTGGSRRDARGGICTCVRQAVRRSGRPAQYLFHGDETSSGASRVLARRRSSASWPTKSPASMPRPHSTAASIASPG